MKRVTASMVAVVALLVLAAGTTLAATYVGTNGPDTIHGSRGNDVIKGLGGNDHLYGGGGSDRIYGGPGNDFINANDDAQRDYIDCGPGYDTVSEAPFPRARDVYVNCERILR